MYTPSWLLLRFWQTKNLKQFGCFCTEKRCKHAQIYPIIPHVQPSSRLKCIVQLSEVDRVKFEHHATFWSVNIIHCSLFYWKLNKPYYLNQCQCDGWATPGFVWALPWRKYFVYNCGRTRTVANPQKSVQCMCCGFLVVRNIHHARIK